MHHIINFYCVVLLLLQHLLKCQAETLNFDQVLDSNDDEDDEHFNFLVSGGLRTPELQRNVRFMVSIRTRQPSKYFGDNHFCAGSIISPDIVLTAAHCVMDRRKVQTRPRRLLIVAGTPNRLRSVNTTIQYPVKSVTPHPKYLRHNTDDIAIIRIKGTFPTDNPYIAIIPLPTTEPPYGQQCLTIGWGRLYYDGPLADETTHVDITLFKPDECILLTPKFWNGTYCAGDHVEYNEDPCRGDSGGPMICNGFLTGIVSWTIGCGSKTYPSLYTEVYTHLSWIKEVMNDASQRQLALSVCLVVTLKILLL